MIQRRHALALGALVPGAVALAACGPNASGSSGGGGSGDADGPASLRLTWWGNPTRDENTRAVVEAYGEVDDAVSISLEPGEWSGYWDKLATQTAGGDLPDIVQMDEKYLAEYGGRDTLLDLSAAGLDTSEFGPGTVEVGEMAGKGLLGINAGINAFGILANREVFEAAGMELPDDATWTWQEFLELSVAISEATDTDVYGVNQIGLNETTFHIFIRQLGQDRFIDGKVGFDADAVTQYYDFIKSLQDTGACPSADQAAEDGALSLDQSRFATSRCAFTVALSNQAVAYSNATPGGVALLRPPSMTGSATDAMLWYKASMYWSVSAATKHPEAALQVVNFIINSPDAGKILSVERGVPGNLTVRETISADLDDANLMALEYLDLIEDELGPAPELTPTGGSELESIIVRAGEDVIFGRISTQEAGQRVVDEVSAALS